MMTDQWKNIWMSTCAFTMLIGFLIQPIFDEQAWLTVVGCAAWLLVASTGVRKLVKERKNSRTLLVNRENMTLLLFSLGGAAAVANLMSRGGG